MPIVARWRTFEALPARRGRDAMPGVYELADEAKRVIYIGQSGRDVPNRIRQHLERHACIQPEARFWRYAFSRIPQAEEAELLARHRDRHGTLPLCNLASQLQRSPESRYRERSRGD